VIYSCERDIDTGDEHRRNNMAEPIRLGLVLEGDDAREFWENMENPRVTKEQVEFFKDAIRLYKKHPF